MHDILIIQWARLGDLLHTRVLLDRIRRACPSCNIALSFDERYADVVALFPEVDEMRPINIKAVAERSRFSESWPDAIDQMLSVGNDKLFDNVLNLTNHVSAGWYAQFLSVTPVSGYRIQDGRLTTPRPLEQLHSQTLEFRAPCHIADLWCSLIETDLPKRIPTYLGDTKDPNRADIAIIADAGAPERSLTLRALEHLSECLREQHRTKILWTGALRECTMTAPHYVEDLRGRTSLSALVKTLAKCKLVVGPDTGALHLAAALGCETIGVYLSGARPERTGPYTLESKCFVYDSLNECSVREVGLKLRCIGDQSDAESSAKALLPVMTHAGIEFTRATPGKIVVQDEPLLSIVITEFCQTHYADNLIEDFLSSNALPRHEIIVSSSGLTPEESEHAENRAGVRALVSRTPLTFSQSCNRAARASRGKWLLFLNDDTEFDGGAIADLWNYRDVNTILAPELIYWDGESQSTGFILRKDGVEELRDSNGAEHQAIPDGVSAAAMLISSPLFKKLGGFDEMFRNGYEDVDLCLRARSIGTAARCLRRARIIHYRGSSPQRFENDDQNLHLLLSRWRDVATARSKPVSRIVRVPLPLLSSCSEAEAGPQSRWLSPLRRLGLGDLDHQWICTRAATDSIALRESLAAAESVIVFRNLESPVACNELLRWKAEKRGRIVLDADDQILNRFIEESPRARLRKQTESEFELLQEAADLCSAPSMRLLELHHVTSKKRLVIPSAPMSEHFHKARAKRIDTTIRFGFAASWAHRTDFAQAAPAVEQFLDEQEDVLFYWWGCHPGKLAHHPQVRHGGPWADEYARHLKRLQRVPIDFWIAPLSDAVHNSVRSPIRAFEFCGMDVPCVVSNVEPYGSLPSDSRLLIKCENSTPAWLVALRAQREHVLGSGVAALDDSMLRCMREAHNDLAAYRDLLRILTSNVLMCATHQAACEAHRDSCNV